MQLEIPYQNAIETEMPNANLATIYNLSVVEVYLLEIKISPSPLTFVEKFLLAAFLPAVNLKSYIDNIYESLEAVLASTHYANLIGYEKVKVDSIYDYFHTVKCHWDSVANYDLGKYKNASPIMLATVLGIQIETLNHSMDTDDIRKITSINYMNQSDFNEMFSIPLVQEFNNIHADLLEKLQTIYNKNAPVAEVIPFNKNVH